MNTDYDFLLRFSVIDQWHLTPLFSGRHFVDTFQAKRASYYANPLILWWPPVSKTQIYLYESIIENMTDLKVTPKVTPIF